MKKVLTSSESLAISLPMSNETENQIRLRRAKESLAAAREMEAHDRKRLNDSIESTKRAKEKYEELFEKEESAEVKRRKGDYRHETN